MEKYMEAYGQLENARQPGTWEPCHKLMMGNGIVGVENLGGDLDKVVGESPWGVVQPLVSWIATLPTCESLPWDRAELIVAVVVCFRCALVAPATVNTDRWDLFDPSLSGHLRRVLRLHCSPPGA